MARTKIKEHQVLDSDFASETEMEDRFTQHLNNKKHLPDVSGTNDYVLYSNGTSSEWRENTGGSTIGGTPVEPYYYDTTRDRYLSFDTIQIDLYIDGTNRKNIYLYSMPSISSSLVPFVVFGEHCMIAYDFYTSSTHNNKDIIEVVDTAAGNASRITINTGNNLTEIHNDTVDIIISDGQKIAGYINNFGLDAPVLRVYLKKTHYPL